MEMSSAVARRPSCWTSRIQAAWLVSLPSPSKTSCRSGSETTVLGRDLTQQGHLEASDVPFGGQIEKVMGLPPIEQQRMEEEALALLRQTAVEYGAL